MRSRRWSHTLRPNWKACRLASCNASGKMRRIAASHSCSENCKCRLRTPSSATLRLFLLRSLLSSICDGLDEDAALAQNGCIHRHLVGRRGHQKIGLALRHHGAEDLRAEAHVAGDRAAALAHAVQFAFLHVQAGVEGDVGHDVGGTSARPARPARRSRY